MNFKTGIQLAYLQNEKWRKTNYFGCSSENEGVGSITITQICKSEIDNWQEGLLYLLQRNCYEIEGWNQAEKWTLPMRNFIDFVIAEGYLSQLGGEKMKVDDFLKNYHEIIKLFNNSSSSKWQKNQKVTQGIPHFNPQNIMAVYSFANRWNNRQYLIETSEDLSFFDWGTTA